MKQAELRKVDAEIAHIIENAHKISAEANKITKETFWYPLLIATGLVGTIAAILTVIIKFL